MSRSLVILTLGALCLFGCDDGSKPAKSKPKSTAKSGKDAAKDPGEKKAPAEPAKDPNAGWTWKLPTGIAAAPVVPDGNPMSAEEWEARKDDWIPSEADRAYITSLMKPCHEQGKIANWIAAPTKGINGNPFDFEYVRL